MYKFHIAPGASGETTREDKMLRAHETEATDRGAECFNYGLSTDENCICSKTSNEILETTINPMTMKIHHVWSRGG
jgi:hypothetical protein